MPDPTIMAIATAVAGQTAQTLTAQATGALAESVKRITRKFRDRPADLALLSNALDAQVSANEISQFADALQRADLDDPDFGREITAFWTQMRAETNTATSDGLVNTFHGHADKVIQLRDVHGGLTIN